MSFNDPNGLDGCSITGDVSGPPSCYDGSYNGPPPSVTPPEPSFTEQVTIDESVLIDGTYQDVSTTTNVYLESACKPAGGLQNGSTGCGYQPFSQGFNTIPNWYLAEAGGETFSPPNTDNSSGIFSNSNWTMNPPTDNTFYTPDNPNPYPPPPPYLGSIVACKPVVNKITIKGVVYVNVTLACSTPNEPTP